MPIVFLDDNDNRAALAYQRWPSEKRNNTIWVKTASDAIDILKNYEDIEEVHLDHDLGGEQYVDSRREDSGMEVIRVIEKMVKKNGIGKFQGTKFFVHSWNIPAANNMFNRLEKLGLDVELKPFGM